MSRLQFFAEYLKNIRSIGSVVSSSRFLAAKMVKAIDPNAGVVVEFGGGHGVVTEAILKRLGPNSRLIVFETNNRFFEHLSLLKDARLRVIHDSAETLPQYLKELGITQVDCIVSGLPFTSLPSALGERILRVVLSALAPDGTFAQFQYSLFSLRDLRKLFQTVTVGFTFLNIPPAFVYVCKR